MDEQQVSSEPTPIFRKFNYDEKSYFQGERLNNSLLQYVDKNFAERSELMVAVLNVEVFGVNFP